MAGAEEGKEFPRLQQQIEKQWTMTNGKEAGKAEGRWYLRAISERLSPENKA